MQLKPEERPFIEIVHDESACNANDGLKFQYVHTRRALPCAPSLTERAS